MRRKDIRTLGLIDIWTLGCQEFQFLPLRGVRLGEKRGDIGHIYCYTTYEGSDDSDEYQTPSEGMTILTYFNILLS